MVTGRVLRKRGPDSRAGRRSTGAATVSIHFDCDDLRTLAANSTVDCRSDLLEAFGAAASGVTATQTVAASHLVPAYEVRMARWKEEGLPPSGGLDEFVAELRRLGDEQVVITSDKPQPTTYVLLISLDPYVLRGCVAIRRREASSDHLPDCAVE